MPSLLAIYRNRRKFSNAGDDAPIIPRTPQQSGAYNTVPLIGLRGDEGVILCVLCWEIYTSSASFLSWYCSHRSSLISWKIRLARKVPSERWERESVT